VRFERSGKTYWFTNRKIPIEDPISGDVKYILGLAEDITSHRAAERSLEDSRQRMSRILENVGESIYGINAAGDLTFINQAATDTLGYTESYALGRHAHTLLHHHSKSGQLFALGKCSINQTLMTGKSYRIDDEVFWKGDGTSMAVQYVSTPIIEEHKVVGAFVVFSDISKRIVLERLQLEQTRRIEQINEELEEFSYVASHDIQEPLRALNCFCDFLTEDLGDELS
jgi:PAS domain S-box-containing protein